MLKVNFADGHTSSVQAVQKLSLFAPQAYTAYVTKKHLPSLI